MMKNIMLLSAILSIMGCNSGDYRLDLENGFSYVRTNAQNHVITNSQQKVIVDSNIIHYAYNSQWVIGNRIPSKAPDSETTQPYGYFLINAATREVVWKSSKYALQELIKKNYLESMAFTTCEKQQCKHSVDWSKVLTTGE